MEEIDEVPSHLEYDDEKSISADECEGNSNGNNSDGTTVNKHQSASYALEGNNSTLKGISTLGPKNNNTNCTSNTKQSSATATFTKVESRLDNKNATAYMLTSPNANTTSNYIYNSGNNAYMPQKTETSCSFNSHSNSAMQYLSSSTNHQHFNNSSKLPATQSSKAFSMTTSTALDKFSNTNQLQKHNSNISSSLEIILSPIIQSSRR